MSDLNTTELAAARDEFVTQWGAMGNSWGINRTMAQIHALLMISNDPLSTDEIMEDLKVSRGNANMNLRELVGWGLIRGIVRKGERKEYFEAEKDVWKIFCTVARERKRREIDPAREVLLRCLEQTHDLKGPEAAAFKKQLTELSDFISTASTLMEKISASSRSKLLPLATKMLK